MDFARYSPIVLQGCVIGIWLSEWLLQCHKIWVESNGAKPQLRSLQTNISPVILSWWRHRMETFSALLPCEDNPPLTDAWSSQRPVTRSFDVFFDLRLNQQLSKHSRRRWLRRHRAHYDVTVIVTYPHRHCSPEHADDTCPPRCRFWRNHTLRSCACPPSPRGLCAGGSDAVMSVDAGGPFRARTRHTFGQTRICTPTTDGRNCRSFKCSIQQEHSKSYSTYHCFMTQL